MNYATGLSKYERNVVDRLRDGAKDFRYNEEVYSQADTAANPDSKPEVRQDSLAGY